MYYVYIAKNEDSYLYVGITNNPNRRLAEHNVGRGSIHTAKGTFKIVFLEEHDTLASARKREIQIKKWRRDKKEMLIDRYQKGLDTKR